MNFNKESLNILDQAKDISLHYEHGYIAGEHILLATMLHNSDSFSLGGQKSNKLHKVLKMFSISPTTLESKLRELKGDVGSSDVFKNLQPEDMITFNLKESIESISSELDIDVVCVHTLLLAILTNEIADIGTSYMISCVRSDYTTNKVIDALAREAKAVHNQNKLNDNNPSGYATKDTSSVKTETKQGLETKQMEKLGKKFESLLKYGKDLTYEASNQEVEEIIGRDSEVDTVAQILARKTKNNPCLVGEPGVGKTAVIEGLARRIATGKAPKSLLNKRVIAINIINLISGTKYRGSFEERLATILKEAKSSEIILFIDEFHTVMNAGASEGSTGAADLLKPYLARNEISFIGATTNEEYRKHILKDGAMARRFQQVTIDEPSTEQAVDIIKGCSASYEKYHNVKITDEAIDAAVKLSKRYITDRCLPDKAFDLLDASCVKASNLNSEVDATLIAQSLYEQTGIPLAKIQESDSEKILNLPTALSEKVVGQDDAIARVTNTLMYSYAGLNDNSKPLASFLFTGSTGTGKTELAKALAESLFGSSEKMIRLDMSEYSEKSSISKLIGTAPGYIGYEDGGKLTEAVRRNPYSVILFDEIEKADKSITNLFLQILDDGRLTDSSGRTVSFNNTIIIFTSNIVKSEDMVKKAVVGFSNQGNANDGIDTEKISLDVRNKIGSCFTPEFANRIDEVILFNNLDRKHLVDILDSKTAFFVERLKAKSIDINISDSSKQFIVNKGISESKFGVRALNRLSVKYIENIVAKKILTGDIKAGDTVNIDCKDDVIDVVTI